jgi:hypothetical protein
MRDINLSLFTDNLLDPAETLEKCISVSGSIVRAMFPQTYFDTGRQTGYIIVIERHNDACYDVFFNGSIMYTVCSPNVLFKFDVNNHCMISKNKYSGQYEEKYK